MLKLRHTLLALAGLFAATAGASPLELRLLNVDGKGIPAAVVVLRSTDAARPLARPLEAQMNQAGLQFVPHVLVVPAGSKVSFPNSDSVSHQVYSFSAAKKFEVPLYRGTQNPPLKEFDRAGVVTLGCNIHDSMRAYVYVVEAQYFGRTDANGLWKGAEVQPGTYIVQIWHPRARDSRPVLEQQVTVTAADPHLALRVATKLQLRPETTVPANWDAY